MNNFLGLFLVFSALCMHALYSYNRLECVTCTDGGSVYTPDGCKSVCAADTWCYKTQSQCISNCDFCIQVEGLKFSSGGCGAQCPQDTWCYTPQSGCPAANKIPACVQCHTFGYYWLNNFGCTDFCDGVLSNCIAPGQNCNVGRPSTCEQCVKNGGFYNRATGQCMGAANPFMPSTQIC